MALLLKGGRLVDPAAGLDTVADVVIRDGVIVEIGEDLTIPKGVTIECAEKVVLPGLVDLHVHLREPGREDEETVSSGKRAAAHGGFAGICPMPNTEPVADEGSAITALMDLADDGFPVQVFPVGAMTVKQAGELMAEIGDMHHAGAVAFSDDGRCVQDSGVMRRVMDYAKMFPVTLMSHCQDDALAGRGVVNEGVVSTRLGLPGYPAAAEEIMIARDIALCELTGCRVHVQHVSTARGVELIRVAKAAGLPVTCEVTPHHLFLDEDMLDLTYDTNRKMNPPLRTAADREALLDGLVDGTVDAIATDHAPHAAHEKQLEFELAPFGTTGLETALSLVNTHLVACGRVTWSQVAQWMCHGPRSCVPLIPEQRIEVGRPGTLTIVDPEARVEVTREWFVGTSRNSAFLGAKLLGKATEVLVDGEWALKGGKVVER